ncbi:retrovirus-related pol polyprotein from transposon TNT 1-94 [Tanacetum coccineum]
MFDLLRISMDNLYTLSLGNMMASSPICLLSKASKTKSWLWHRRLSHLNFGAINHLARHRLVRGLPKLKFKKDHLCSACALGKSSKKPHKPKSEDTNQEKLYLLHMDLCGPMRVASVNGKKYILMIQVRLKETVCRIRTDNGTEFVNQTLREYYEKVGISHETSIALSPQQNSVVKRRNHTLVEASRIMLIYAKAPLFLWAEAVATACYTQNRSMIRRRHGKTPYELLHDKPPDLSNSHTTQETQTPIISHNVEEDNHDIEVAHMGNDPYFGIPIPEVASDQSSSSDVIHTIVPPDHQVSEHNSKWTKDHPLENIIGNLDRPVSTRLQLHEQALFCYYDAFLTLVEPKNYKDALTQACWIEAMQEELHEFELADHACCQDTRRSTSGSIQLLGDRLVSWSSKRQKSAAISSTEAEYIAFSGGHLTKALGRESNRISNQQSGYSEVLRGDSKKLADDVDE